MLEQTKIYFNFITTVIDNLIEYNEVMNGGSTMPTRENALTTLTNFSIQNGNYSFDDVENAIYYVVSVYEESGSLDAVGALTI